MGRSKRASLPEGAVDFVHLNASFMQNIGSIIRPRNDQKATLEDYRKLLIDFEYNKRAKGRNALDNSGGAFASMGAVGSSSLGFQEMEDSTRQSLNNADLHNQLSQSTNMTNNIIYGAATTASFFN